MSHGEGEYLTITELDLITYSSILKIETEPTMVRSYRILIEVLVAAIIKQFLARLLRVSPDSAIIASMDSSPLSYRLHEGHKTVVIEKGVVVASVETGNNCRDTVVISSSRQHHHVQWRFTGMACTYCRPCFLIS